MLTKTSKSSFFSVVRKQSVFLNESCWFHSKGAFTYDVIFLGRLVIQAPSHFTK